MSNVLSGRFRSFRFGGIIGSCRRDPYGIVGSLESESIVTICGSSDAMNDIDINSWVSLPDISVELAYLVWLGSGHWMTVPQKTHQSQSN